MAETAQKVKKLLRATSDLIFPGYEDYECRDQWDKLIAHSNGDNMLRL